MPVLTSSSGGSGVSQNPFLFKGGIQDRATGWVHYGNRWYNPNIGRWTQQDTLDAPLDPTNANRYAYAGCDPINNTDPTGQASGACYGAIARTTASAILTGIAFLGIIGSVAAGLPLLAGAVGAFFFSTGVARTVGFGAGIVDSC